MSAWHDHRTQGQAVKSHLNAANLALKAMHRQQQMELLQKEFERKQQAAGVRDVHSFSFIRSTVTNLCYINAQHAHLMHLTRST